MTSRLPFPVKFVQGQLKNQHQLLAPTMQPGGPASIPRDQPAVFQHGHPLQGPVSSLPVQPALPGASQQPPSAASGSSLCRVSQSFQGPASSLPAQPAVAAFLGASQQPPSAASSSSLPRGQPAFPGASQQSPSAASSSSLPRGQPAVSQSTSLKWNYTHTFGSCKYVSMYFTFYVIYLCIQICTDLVV